MTGDGHGRGGLDQVSFELGRIASSQAATTRLFEQHCQDDDRRHEENVALLRANTDAIAALTAALKPVADSVAFMRPIVDGYVVTRGRLALLASVGLGIVVFVGWLLEAGLKWAVGWLLKAKFGG